VLRRVLAGFFMTTGAALAAASGLPSCGTDAVGVEACRALQTARCDATLACGSSETEVENCKLFYHDQCLHGIENPSSAAATGAGGAGGGEDTSDPTQTQVDGCVAAIRAVGQCAQSNIATMQDCTAVQLTEPSDGSVNASAKRSPCDVLKQHPEDMAACAFVAKPVTDPDAGALPDAGDADVFIL
jgi:hypothetical protein